MPSPFPSHASNLKLAAFAFVLAGLTSLAMTPLARRLALRVGLMDNPNPSKAHRAPTPYLGGLAIIGGILVGAVATGAWREVGGIALGAALVAGCGFIDDARSLNPYVRLGAQTTAAAVVVAFGAMAHPTGIYVFDASLTLFWIVGITNAFNLLDNMNGLSGGMAAMTGVSLLVLAILQGQRLVAALAAALVGGALGFLPHNFPRARIFMGDGGSVTLGFLVAVVSLKLRFPVSHPWSFAAIVIVLGVAITDTVVVVLDRLRSGRPVMVAGTDHLSHRLVASGMSRPSAVLLLMASSGFCGLIGVAVGRGASPELLVPAAAAVLVLNGVVFLKIQVNPRQGQVTASDKLVTLKIDSAHELHAPGAIDLAGYHDIDAAYAREPIAAEE